MDDVRKAERRPAKPSVFGTHTPKGRPSFECIALLLQGGGALGAYQGGVYQALTEADIQPDWVAGVSIGAVNAALIAGNEPTQRVDKLRRFWESVTAGQPWGWATEAASRLSRGDDARAMVNQASAVNAVFSGVAGFFTPRFPGPWWQPPGSLEATSYYDTRPLRATLETLVDFDRINSREMRFSVGAVNVRTGNFVYFDNARHRIGPEHVMASGGLPPGFPAVEIEGQHYWDGGLISNTPLQWVLQYGPRQDTLAFQVDLWSARGDFPRTIVEVATRQKDITYSSRTRENTDRFKNMQKIRHAVAHLLAALPEGQPLDHGAADILKSFADRKVYNLVHLIYRAQRYEGDSKDYEFSRVSMEEHWRAGYNDTIRSLRHPEILERPTCVEGLAVFDFTQD